jgi:redox-sensitive bicupin YhaK (pirin superfamily)
MIERRPFDRLGSADHGWLNAKHHFSLKAGSSAEYAFDDERLGYLVPATGRVEINGVTLEARDGAAISREKTIRVTALEDAELVLVDSAP